MITPSRYSKCLDLSIRLLSNSQVVIDVMVKHMHSKISWFVEDVCMHTTRFLWKSWFSSENSKSYVSCLGLQVNATQNVCESTISLFEELWEKFSRVQTRS